MNIKISLIRDQFIHFNFKHEDEVDFKGNTGDALTDNNIYIIFIQTTQRYISASATVWTQTCRAQSLIKNKHETERSYPQSLNKYRMKQQRRS